MHVVSGLALDFFKRIITGHAHPMRADDRVAPLVIALVMYSVNSLPSISTRNLSPSFLISTDPCEYSTRRAGRWLANKRK